VGDFCIEVEDLHKSFNGEEVLRGISLKILRGKITVILGKSGVGKSVLLKHFIGLLKPDRGRVLVDGMDIMTLPPPELRKLREKFGMLFQSAALFDSMTVFENVAFPLVEHTSYDRDKIREIVLNKLALVGLHGVENKMPSELSGGMRKRVGLARAIALEPEILLYDEPTTGLDPVMARSVDNLIVETQEKLKITSVVISHDIMSALDIADTVVMLDKGKVIFEGKRDEFISCSHPAVVEFMGVR
jgi:phospholipid/cholesterol/gamma-HCH transport system ATP-binding protein